MFRNFRWYRLCANRRSEAGAAVAAAPQMAMASTRWTDAATAANPTAAAAPIPAATRCADRMRLPVAANARSRRLDRTVGSALRCGPDLRNDKTGTSELEAVIAMVLSRGSKFALRRSARSTRRSAPPSRIAVRSAVKRIGSNNSGLPNTKRFQEVSFETEARRAHDEIGTHPI